MQKDQLETKEHIPLILRLEILAFLVVLLLVIKISVGLIFSVKSAHTLDLTVENILSTVNRERELRNLTTLNLDNRLARAAAFKAQDMIDRNYFAHVDPDGNYIWPKIVAEGYTPYQQLGENLAIEFYSTENLVAAWMNSPTHRANIVNSGFKDQGMGLSFGSNSQYHSSVANTFGALVVTQKPKSTEEPAKITEQKNPQPVLVVPNSTPVSKPSPPKPKPVPLPVQPPTPPTQTQIPLNTEASSTSKTQILPRIALENENTLPEKNIKPILQNTTFPVFSQDANNSKTKAENNRYVVLSIGFVLLFILTKDLQVFFKKHDIWHDKKINNLTVLILSLIIVALLRFF